MVLGWVFGRIFWLPQRKWKLMDRIGKYCLVPDHERPLLANTCSLGTCLKLSFTSMRFSIHTRDSSYALLMASCVFESFVQLPVSTVRWLYTVRDKPDTISKHRGASWSFYFERCISKNKVNSNLYKITY